MLALPLSLARWAPNSINRPIYIDDLESALGSEQTFTNFNRASHSRTKQPDADAAKFASAPRLLR